MKRLQLKSLLLASLLPAAMCASAGAQSVENSGGSAGGPGNNTYYTGEGPSGMGGNYTFPTVTQSPVALPTYLGRLAPAVRGIVGLPPCSMDSFVRNAGARADLIYGDEGTNGPPPYYGFTNIHRIDQGITGDRSSGLTTGHASHLPSAWGNDEFLGAEWYGTYSPPASSSSVQSSDTGFHDTGSKTDTRKVRGAQ